MEASLKAKLAEAVDAVQKAAVDATHNIWLHPEQGDHETYAVSYLTDVLRKEGFTEDEVEQIFFRNAQRFFEENL